MVDRVYLNSDESHHIVYKTDIFASLRSYEDKMRRLGDF